MKLENILALSNTEILNAFEAGEIIEVHLLLHILRKMESIEENQSFIFEKQTQIMATLQELSDNIDGFTTDLDTDLGKIVIEIDALKAQITSLGADATLVNSLNDKVTAMRTKINSFDPATA